MFYSHEVLTSRKYGVATVWLVATLGSKTSLKKVSRKAILDVNIEKTCETIAESSVPMALRLQSSLLYGVTRVYSQQCGYVLADIESVRNDMRSLAKALCSSASTMQSTSRGRAENLMLHDDPDFLPEIDFGLADLSILEEPSQQHDSIATSLLPSTLASSVDYASLDIPSLHTPSIPRSLQSGHLHDKSIRHSQRAEYEGLQDDLDIDFLDETGYSLANVEDEMPYDHHGGATLPHTQQPQPQRDSAEVQESLDPAPLQSLLSQDDEAQALSASSTVSSSAYAPLRRNAPAKKSLPLDNVTQLRAHVLKEWSTNYLQIMKQQRKHKAGASARTLAKDNARFWFYGTRLHDPLEDFQSAMLLRMKSSKRPREEDDNEPATGERRVKSRQSSVHPIEADDGFQPMDDTFMPDYGEIEVGRAQRTPLQDRHSTLLPWSHSTQSAVHSRLSSLQPRASQRLASPAHMLPQPSDDAEFEAFGPAMHVDTQTAAESQWLRSTLEDESVNFLRFLEDTLDQSKLSSIAFQELLPASQHTAIVAAQAFMHVLALSTRSMIETTQIEPLDDIQLRIA